MTARDELDWPKGQRGVSELVHSAVIGDDVRREVIFQPGHPLTEPYGRSTLRIAFVLHGAKGTVEFEWSTGIGPEKVTRLVEPKKEWSPEGLGFARMAGIISTEPYTVEEWYHSAASSGCVSYHADDPQYEGQTFHDDCGFRPAGVCHWDASYTLADRFLEAFLTKGEGAMWEMLEHQYVKWLVEPDENRPD